MSAARRLALGRLISVTGGSAAFIALTAAVYDATGSAVWLSAALFAGVVGTVLAAPFAGWVGDRFDRRRVLIVSDVAAAAVSAGMAATGRPEALVVLFLVSAIVEAPFEPASAAALPNVVGPADVQRANSLMAATSSAGYLLGPFLGGVVLGFGASAATLFAVDAATFVVSAAFVASIGRPFGRGGTDAHPGALAGFRVVVREPVLRLVVGAGMASLLGIGIVGIASYPLSLELGGGKEAYGAMTALLGGGGIVGAALAARLSGVGRPRLLVAGSAAVATGLALSAAAPVVVAAVIGMAVAGAGRGLADVAATTLVQAQTADAVRSRVFAAEDAAAHVAFTVAAVTGGVLVELGGVRLAVAVAAAGGAAAAVIAARIDDRHTGGAGAVT